MCKYLPVILALPPGGVAPQTKPALYFCPTDICGHFDDAGIRRPQNAQNPKYSLCGRLRLFFNTTLYLSFYRFASFKNDSIFDGERPHCRDQYTHLSPLPYVRFFPSPRGLPPGVTVDSYEVTETSEESSSSGASKLSLLSDDVVLRRLEGIERALIVARATVQSMLHALCGRVVYTLFFSPVTSRHLYRAHRRRLVTR